MLPVVFAALCCEALRVNVVCDWVLGDLWGAAEGFLCTTTTLPDPARLAKITGKINHRKNPNPIVIVNARNPSKAMTMGTAELEAVHLSVAWHHGQMKSS
jgi:hypothetical protein